MVETPTKNNLWVGINESNEVVISHPNLLTDAEGCGYIVFSPLQARLLAALLEKHANAVDGEDLRDLERSLAYDEASSMIDSMCAMESTDDRLEAWWNNIDDIDDMPGVEEAIADAVRYLDSRGLLERHPNHPNWVRVLDEDAAPVEAEATR
jgi:hypothetical protein